MDIRTIDATITELENSETTLENIEYLAHLYTVRSILSNSVNVENEYNDILPAYSNYINIKKQYQMGDISEGAVIKALKYVCTEIIEFLLTLYSGTDMNKERKCLKDMINTIYSEFENK